MEPGDGAKPPRRSETFCVLPFNSVAIGVTGAVRVCCHNNRVPRAADGRTYSFDDPAFVLESALDNPLHREIRRSMLQGERHPSCSGCWDVEDSGGTSYRQIWNEHFKERIPDYLDNVDANGSLARVRSDYFELSLGNRCNLRCRSCSPIASNQWTREARLLKLFPEELLRQTEHYTWLGQESFWASIDRLLPITSRLSLLGGEPLFIDEQYRILERAVECGWAGGIELQYNSNLTKVAPALKELWSRFKSVNLAVSADAVGPLGQYLRHPLKWDTFEANLRRVLSWQTVAPLRVSIHSTIQALNLFGLPDLLDWVYALGIPYARVPMVTWVTNPMYLDPRVLPRSAREQAYERVCSALERLQARGLEANERAHAGVIKANAENFLHDWPDELRLFHFGELVTNTEALDRLRDENVEHFIPDWPRWKTA